MFTFLSIFLPLRFNIIKVCSLLIVFPKTLITQPKNKATCFNFF